MVDVPLNQSYFRSVILDHCVKRNRSYEREILIKRGKTWQYLHVGKSKYSTRFSVKVSCPLNLWYEPNRNRICDVSPPPGSMIRHHPNRICYDPSTGIYDTGLTPTESILWALNRNLWYGPHLNRIYAMSLPLESMIWAPPQPNLCYEP